ncbi:MAG: hypothetical protein RR274_06600 [Erysipelotrichaceae bacterium]
MLKIKNDRYKESYVEETLDNGLHVVLWNKPDYEKSYFMMATPLGAMDIQQIDKDGKFKYKFDASVSPTTLTEPGLYSGILSVKVTFN